MGLVYHLMEEDEYFQIFLLPDGTEKEGAFWSPEESSGPEVYTIEEMEASGRAYPEIFWGDRACFP